MSEEEATAAERMRQREYDWASGRLSEDLALNVVPGGPASYSRETEKAVEYVTVAAEDGEVLGYLWACDADDAAGWQVRPAGGDDAYNAGVAWTMKLRSPKERGIAPSQALAELAADPGGPRIGRVVEGSRTLAANLAELREIAGPKPPRPDTPRTRRGA